MAWTCCMCPTPDDPSNVLLQPRINATYVVQSGTQASITFGVGLATSLISYIGLRYLRIRAKRKLVSRRLAISRARRIDEMKADQAASVSREQSGRFLLSPLSPPTLSAHLEVSVEEEEQQQQQQQQHPLSFLHKAGAVPESRTLHARHDSQGGKRGSSSVPTKQPVRHRCVHSHATATTATVTAPTHY